MKKFSQYAVNKGVKTNEKERMKGRKLRRKQIFHSVHTNTVLKERKKKQS